MGGDHTSTTLNALVMSVSNKNAPGWYNTNNYGKIVTYISGTTGVVVSDAKFAPSDSGSETEVFG